MREYSCTETLFLVDIKDHSLNIISDDGVFRHLSFTDNGSSVYRFDLITWPGYLCITGDCGTYVFSRLKDMFSFFRMRDNDFNKKEDVRLNINPGYWGEKLESVCNNGGYKQFDKEQFEVDVIDFAKNYCSDEEKDQSFIDELLDTLECDVINCADNEYIAYGLINDFSHEGFDFDGFFDERFSESYTFHYIWCLYAIVYGIEQYDLAKTGATQQAKT